MTQETEKEVDYQPVMIVKLMAEHGYEEGTFGMGLSKGLTTPYADYPSLPDEVKARLASVAAKLAPLDGGHNKFLESMLVWLDVTAPRFWWQEADTYRISTKNSASTMHTLDKDLLKAMDASGIKAIQEMFEPGTCDTYNACRIYAMVENPDIPLEQLKSALHEGFLQRREWCMSYKTLRNIVAKRRKHRLPHWRTFCESLLSQLAHPEFVTAGLNEE